MLGWGRGGWVGGGGVGITNTRKKGLFDIVLLFFSCVVPRSAKYFAHGWMAGT